MSIQCIGSINATIKFSGVSPASLQELHNLVASDENKLPISIEGAERETYTFNCPGRFIEIAEVKLVTEISCYGYDVVLDVHVFGAHKVFSRDDGDIFYAPIPRDLLLKIFLAINPDAVPETFAYIKRK